MTVEYYSMCDTDSLAELKEIDKLRTFTRHAQVQTERVQILDFPSTDESTPFSRLELTLSDKSCSPISMQFRSFSITKAPTPPNSTASKPASLDYFESSPSSTVASAQDFPFLPCQHCLQLTAPPQLSMWQTMADVDFTRIGFQPYFHKA